MFLPVVFVGLSAAQHTADNSQSTCLYNTFRLIVCVSSLLTIRWIVYAEGVPHINNATEVSALPSEVKFSFSKMSEFIYTKAAA